MLMSSDRIPVCHVGSLPRSPTLSGLLIGHEASETIDATALAHEVESPTAHVINKQVAAGADVGNDGEQSRVGFQTYVPRERIPLCGSGRLSSGSGRDSSIRQGARAAVPSARPCAGEATPGRGGSRVRVRTFEYGTPGSAP